jgi:S-DNA-T family DNA segregation ATPase FtsK/SpoIIIE
MATKRRTTTPRRTPTRRRRGWSFPALSISPEVARSLFGLTMLVLGVVTMIMIFLPAGQGSLTEWAQRTVNPLFGTGRWLLPFLLIAGGAYVEWGSAPAPGWQWRLLAAAIAYVAFLALLEFLPVRGGGRIGTSIADALRDVIGNDAVVFVLLLGILIGGIVVALQRPLRSFVDPVVQGVKVTGANLTAPPESRTEPKTARGARSVAPSRLEPVGPGPVGGSILDEPAPTVGVPQTSQTFAFGDPGAIGAAGRAAAGAAATAVATRPRVETDERPTALESLQAIDWTLPPIGLLEPRAPGRAGVAVDHESNKRRIEEKLHSFAIPAKVVAVNSGPVVTQYEVKPEHHVKVSRIEALADDLAMALSARSIRIEAPIPGRDVVGIEIPNKDSEIVGFRPLIEETNMLAASSPLTFALGRDVSGKSIAVDLAKMPHLLIAGATGSGKSVCVNALITSLLMRAHPDEVRLILVDLKRVELAPYDKLPHLLQHVIVEPSDAKAVLNWAVREMEERYKRLASHGVRNIAAYNARPDVASDGAERLPYIVLIIDELADLIMREGRKVEDPVVKIAQKARAVGIHLVLATQRPSVNVVTGLIKANVPSRIAFAMASMIDSRTVLDAPGAEDLIGRGDMLYQPVDLPRPVRMQGVFVSDREVGEVTRHWIEQTDGRTFYDEDILAFAEAEDGGANGSQFGWLRKYEVDDMTVPAAELVTSSNRASTSMLQTKLGLGFARASRVMDQLERYGIVGPQDPRNPATPRQIYGPDNWLRTVDDGSPDD